MMGGAWAGLLLCCSTALPGELRKAEFRQRMRGCGDVVIPFNLVAAPTEAKIEPFLSSGSDFSVDAE